MIDVQQFTALQPVIIISRIVQIILSIYVLVYLSKLDDMHCECALGWKRSTIQTILIIDLIFNFIVILGLFFNTESIHKILLGNINVFSFFQVILLLAAFFNAVLTLDYLYDIRDCQCSKHSAKTFLLFMSIIAIVQFAISIISLSNYCSIIYISRH